MSYPTSQLRYNRQNSTPRGIRTTENNYPDVYEPIEQLSIIQEPDIKYELTEHFLSVTSSARGDSQPLHFNFYINLPRVYENVVKVEMISATFPNSSGITNQPYLVYDIDEINCIDFIISDHNTSGFAVLPIKPSTGAFINPELGCMFHTSYSPKQAKKLARLTIKIKDVNGNLYDFGFPNGTTDILKQNSFLLKIITQDTDRSILKSRNVY